MDLAAEALQQLTRAWLAKIKIALEFRKPFLAVADQCTTFFAGTAGEFWSNDFQNRFLGTQVQQKFKIQINKAFELVALFGPVLYNRNPVRSNNPITPLELEIEAFGDPNDPQVQWMFQQLQAQQQAEFARIKVGSRLMERYLNYTPDEQPGGGLRRAGERAVTDALVTGRGILWPGVYQFPGSDRKLTGSFYDSYRNFVSDPDSREIDFGRSKWIARLHVDTTWEVERRFRLPKGSLKGRGAAETAEGQAERDAYDLGEWERQQGNTFDQFMWWEIFSIGGAGGRLAGFDTPMKQALDRYVGDYAYICIADGVEYPLNLPTEVARTAMPEEVQKRLSWPVPYWHDRRWPCALLEFYEHPRKNCPIAPMAPGLGELAFLNFLLSRIARRTWDATRLLTGVAASARKEVEKALNSLDEVGLFPIEDVYESLDKIISFLEVPDITKDAWTLASAVMELFDKRTGLTELWYSMSSSQSRTAADIHAKQEKASIRPDYMAGKVEDWQSEVAQMEKMAAHWGGVSSRDVAPHLGAVGASLWDQLVLTAPFELVARQMRSKVVAGTARRRNKQLELENVTQIYQSDSAMLANYAQATTDTGPINALRAKAFDAMGFDTQDMALGPWAPPPPEGPSPEEMKAQMEVQKMQMELQKIQAEIALKQQDAMAQQDLERQAKELELQLKSLEHAQEMAQDRQRHEQDLDQAEEAAELKLRLEEMKARVQSHLAARKAEAQADAQRTVAKARASQPARSAA